MNAKLTDIPAGKTIVMDCCGNRYETVAETIGHQCPVKQTIVCRQCGTWGDDSMPSYAKDMCGYCSAQGSVALVWVDADLAIPFTEDDLTYPATSTTIVSNGPRGEFTAFADSIATVNKWIRQGYLHKHSVQQIPIRHDVCPCNKV